MKIIHQLLLALSLSAYSGPIFGQNDPFYGRAAMPGGPFAGQPLNTSRIRSFVDLEGLRLPEIEKIGLGYKYLANVTHDGRFYIGRVHKDAPLAMSLVYEKFVDTPGGHGEVVFHFAPSRPMALLYEVTDSASGSGYIVTKLDQPILLPEVVFTAELVHAQGDTSSLVEGGLSGRFAMAYRLTSVPERLIPTVIGEGRKTTVFYLPHSPKRVAQSFWTSVKKYSALGMSQNYDLVSHNCITVAIDVAQSGLSDQRRAEVQNQLDGIKLELNSLNLESVSDEKIQDMISRLVDVVKLNNRSIVVQDIHDQHFFLKWLTSSQHEQIKARHCRSALQSTRPPAL